MRRAAAVCVCVAFAWDAGCGGRPAAPAPAKQTGPLIPGLLPEDVVGSLERQGFQVKQGTTGGWDSWGCLRDEPFGYSRVEVWGRRGEGVNYVHAHASLTVKTGDPHGPARRLFAAVIDASCDGTERAAVRAWADENVAKNARVTAGAVEIEMTPNLPTVYGMVLRPRSPYSPAPPLRRE